MLLLVNACLSGQLARLLLHLPVTHRHAVRMRALLTSIEREPLGTANNLRAAASIVEQFWSSTLRLRSAGDDGLVACCQLLAAQSVITRLLIVHEPSADDAM